MTRPTAVITYLWEKHLGALDEFLRAHPVDAVVVDEHHLNDRLRDVAERHGCTLVTLQQRFAQTAAFRETALKAVGGLRGRLDGTEWVGEGMVEGPDEIPGLRALLLQQPDRFPTTVTEKLLSYALGRRLEYYDRPAVRRIVRDAAGHDYRWSSLILGIVNSPTFVMRGSS